jgi:uncharacterized membrane-anchored protein YhcB (DUF1043 family)
MKSILALSILFCIIAHSAHCEPPQNSVETDIAVIKTEIKNLKESMNTGFANMRQNFDNIQNNFDRQNNIIIACIGIPMVILTIGATIWGILAYRRSRKEDTLQNQIETLTQEIETLKQQRIVS